MLRHKTEKYRYKLAKIVGGADPLARYRDRDDVHVETDVVGHAEANRRAATNAFDSWVQQWDALQKEQFGDNNMDVFIKPAQDPHAILDHVRSLHAEILRLVIAVGSCRENDAITDEMYSYLKDKVMALKSMDDVEKLKERI